MKMHLQLIFAVAGVCILYILSNFSSPPEIKIKDLWKYDGKEVTIEGKVKNKVGKLFEVSDGNATAFVYTNNNFSYGDKIKVTGNVDINNKGAIIYAHEIKLIKKWNENCLSVPYLAENFEDFIGCNVNITGYIYSIYSDYFYLTDETGEYEIKVYYDASQFNQFDKVYVEGIVKYNSHKMQIYLEGENVCK